MKYYHTSGAQGCRLSKVKSFATTHRCDVLCADAVFFALSLKQLPLIWQITSMLIAVLVFVATMLALEYAVATGKAMKLGQNNNNS